MESADLLRLGFALVFTLALIGLCAFVVQHFGRKLPLLAKGGANARLSVVEWKPLDGRNQIFLIRRDDVEHLVIVSPQSAPVVVETGIRRELLGSPVQSTSPASAPLPLGPAGPVLRS
jgi:flagellar protein FliO/FliZ